MRIIFILILFSCSSQLGVRFSGHDVSIINVELNGQKARFMIDTGSSISVVDINQCIQYNITVIRNDNHGVVRSHTGQNVFHSVRGMPKLTINGKSIKVKLYSMNLSSVNQYFINRSEPLIVGIIGLDILQSRSALIDYKTKRVTLR
jgi:hypothetical protein